MVMLNRLLSEERPSFQSKEFLQRQKPRWHGGIATQKVVMGYYKINQSKVTMYLFPDDLNTVQIFWRTNIWWSRSFTDSLKTVRNPSGWSENFPDGLENFDTFDIWRGSLTPGKILLFSSLAFRHVWSNKTRNYIRHIPEIRNLLTLFEFLFDKDNISGESQPIQVFKRLELRVLWT